MSCALLLLLVIPLLLEPCCQEAVLPLLSLRYTEADQFLRYKISFPLPALDPTYVLTLENPTPTPDTGFRLFSPNKPTAF